MKRLLLLVYLLSVTQLYAQNGAVISGCVSGERGEEISFGYVQLANTLTHNNYGGSVTPKSTYTIESVPHGEYLLYVFSSGYSILQDTITINADIKRDIILKSFEATIDDVVVTANESRGVTSSSLINKQAISHLQPTSLTDLIELLPGGKSVDPNMGEPNLVSLREANSTDMSSLGVGFVIDGAQMSNDANLQSIYNSGASSSLNTVSRGIDMRSIPTDNIESVEVIRGIPTAEYGDITSGMVIINRAKSVSKLKARFKSDQYSKLFSAGKGFSVGKSGDVLNLDLGYLNSHKDPRNTLENYKRATASLRWNGRRNFDSDKGSYIWNLSGDYTGSFDNVKTDEDVTKLTDLYKSNYNKYALSGNFIVKLDRSKIVRSLKATASLSREENFLEQVKYISLNKPTAIPVTNETGEADGVYLPYSYMSEATLEGIPIYANSKIESLSQFSIVSTTHSLKLGAEWNMSRNNGKGETIDPALPITTIVNNVSRPRDFSEIPATQKLSVFVTDNIEYYRGEHRLSASVGVRGSMLANLSDQYYMKNRLMLDPRVNVMWSLPDYNGWRVYVSGGLGYLSKLPTTNQLYPAMSYYDIAQLNYYHNNPDFRRVNFMTYAWNDTNYELTAARNKKWEARCGFSKSGNNFSVTYFNETMRNGFGNTSYYKIFDYKKYDPSSVNSSTLVAPPDLSEVEYTSESRIETFSQSGNIANTYKTGVEFQFSSQRIEALATRITINGAWFRTKHSTDAVQYKGKELTIQNQQLGYVGIYQWEDGSVYQNFNTNTMLDTYIERIGMIFSLSFQCAWFKSYQSLWNDGVPFAYVGVDGIERAFTEADKSDVYLKNLVYNYSDSIFERTTTPFSMDINLKVTKRIGRFMDMAFFVNRIVGVYPEFYRGNTLVRRSSTPYFGMELNLKI